MSGFTGLYHFDDRPVDAALLERMTGHMAFRGPDAQATWQDGAVGFGHTLLRIALESETERQPFTLDGDLWIVADARVDGREELHRKLRDRDPEASLARPDVELILRAYRRWGTACVAHLIGDFAFAIWDAPRRRLFCARDHFGVTPFFYAPLRKGILVGNTLSAMLLHPELPHDLNERVIGDLLLFLMDRTFDSTIYTAIRRLPPAHLLVAEGGQVTIRRYWSPPEGSFPRYGKPERYVEHFRHLFRQAVADRLRSRRVALELSGGMDTGAIAATVRRLRDEGERPFEMQAHTIEVDYLVPDVEGEYAALVARALDIPHRTIYHEEHSLAPPPQPPAFLPPEPAGNMIPTAHSVHLREAAAFSRVLLSGLGGDPLLAPDPAFWYELCSRPRPGEWLAALYQHYRVFGVRRPAGLGLRRRLHVWQGRPDSRLLPSPEWLRPEFSERLGLAARKLALEQGDRARHHRRGMAEYPYWVSLFTRVDADFTGLPLKVLYPFFDVRLYEYLVTVPTVPWLQHKALLRLAMRGSLPEDILLRPKRPLTRDTNLEHETALQRGPQPWQVVLAGDPSLAPYLLRERLQAVIAAPQGIDAAGYRMATGALYLAYWLRHRHLLARNAPAQCRLAGHVQYTPL